jgi:hypothetical protein
MNDTISVTTIARVPPPAGQQRVISTKTKTTG